MSGKIVFTDPQLSSPIWAGDYFSPETHVVRFPAKIDPTLFEDVNAVKVTLTADATEGLDEIQNVVIDATSGNFTLNPLGLGVLTLAFNASPATIQTALETEMGVGNVRVFGAAKDFNIQYIGAYAKTNVATVVTGNGTLAGGGASATASTPQGGVVAATALTVAALSGAIPSGTLIDFGSGKFAKTTAAAAKSATSIAVQAVDKTIKSTDYAYYRPNGVRKQIPSGVIVGRTRAEAAAGAAFGPAASSDDEFFLVLRSITDANKNSDVELYKPGSHVKENFLPEWGTRLAADAALLLKLRQTYICYVGQK